MAYASVLLAVLVLAICQNAALSALTEARFISAAALNANNVYLVEHNKARAAVGVGPLNWSEQLAKFASLMVRYQRNKKGCELANLAKYKYGANQLLNLGDAEAPGMAMESMVKEKAYYDYNSNSCAPNHHCEAYTQVVWKNSSDLGCSTTKCNNQTSLTICFYNPPGNIPGQKPY